VEKSQLKNFILLAQQLNFSAVARQEFLTQPALTRQIDRLEHELGVTLFIRSKHGLTLTYAGEELYKYAVEIYASMQQAENRMGLIRQGQEGFLKVSGVYGMESLIAEGIATFGQQNPKVSISIQCTTGIGQIMKINNKSFDVFYSFASLLEAFPGIESVPLPSDRFIVCIHKRHLGELKNRGLPYLDCLPVYMEEGSEGPFLNEQCMALMKILGLSQENIVYYPSTAAVLIAVQASLGYAILPSQMNYGVLPESIVSFPIENEAAEIRRAIGWHRGTENAVVKNFLQQYGNGD